MGYYTTYGIHTYPPINSDIIRHEFPACELPADLLLTRPETLFYSVKWYAHEEIMVAMSRKMPKIVFILDGLGEDGAEWRKWFRAGRIAEWQRPTAPPWDAQEIFELYGRAAAGE